MRAWTVGCVMAVLAPGLAACERRSAVDAAPPVADSLSVARARAAADALGRDLVTMLQGELRRGGPTAAVAVCADSAQRVTARHATDGVVVRRVGTRLRNPANAPDSLETRLLEYLGQQKLAGTMPSEVLEVHRSGADGEWELRYLRPIVMAPFCTTCHGDAGQIPADVRQLIADRYPDDSAVGYAEGDLRGAITVRVRLSEPR